ncbi:unnamed protein product [Lampetra planeri]
MLFVKLVLMRRGECEDEKEAFGAVRRLIPFLLEARRVCAAVIDNVSSHGGTRRESRSARILVSVSPRDAH